MWHHMIGVYQGMLAQIFVQIWSQLQTKHARNYTTDINRLTFIITIKQNNNKFGSCQA